MFQLFSSRDSIVPKPYSSSRLLSGASLIALIVGLAATPPSADASDGIISYWVNVGAKGTEGRVVPIPFADNVEGGPGQSMGPIDLTNYYGISDASSAAVLIGSIGGRGGGGHDFGTGHASAGAGGKGGDVTVTQKASLSGTPLAWPVAKPLDPQEGTGLLTVFSHGGWGGGPAGYGAGRGGDAGHVTLNVEAPVTAVGEFIIGAWARSAGGNAGSSGVYESQVNTRTGGFAGAVDVVLGPNASITTRGSNSVALLAESLGGTGVERSTGTLSSDYVTDGGGANAVTIDNFGRVSALGANSTAISAQSVGGKGGNQGDSASGVGGAGGNAGDVTIRQWNSATTTGNYSFGIVGQSIGGTGGQGGRPNFFSGGDGGKAGAGKQVVISNYGKISTTGKGSVAIIAQSVGGGAATSAFQNGAIPRPAGGGGAGGQSGIFWGGGGAGGTGGDGGTVRVANGGEISTLGDAAYGILAQSIGGGGGAGGNAVTFGPLVGFALGGRGATGGDSGEVWIDAATPSGDYAGKMQGGPSITTSGEGASGIVALSIGGAGGIGGSATAISATPVAALAIALGGDGGRGGKGNNVTVNNTSSIATSGAKARGIDAKSIGGGGGNAGNAFAYALSVTAPDLPSVSISYALGGKGGDGGGAGAKVAVTNSAAIRTAGSEARGIETVSIGGGGGNGGVGESIANMLSFYANVGASVALGGDGGKGGNGGDVSVVNTNLVFTSGNFASPIFAQSIGGGGGSGGSATATAAAGISWNDMLGEVVSNGVPVADSFTFKHVVGGNSGGGGSGGTVEVTNRGVVRSEGDNAPAIFAQSVGGGGGDAGGYFASGKGTLSVTSAIGGKGGGGGAGGTVTVINGNGAIVETYGLGSIGVFAQSVGGGGGVGGMWSGSRKSLATVEKAGMARVAVDFAEELVKVDKVFVDLLGSKEKKQLEDYKLLDKNSPFQKKVGAAANILKILKPLTAQDKSLSTRLAEAGGIAAGGFLLTKLKDSLKEFYKSVSSQSAASLPNIGLGQTIGGSGGDGGSGGTVSVINGGDILTFANGGWGIVAQSVGGGGGTGGTAAASGDNRMNITGMLGGTGGGGGAGGTVSVINGGTIATTGGGSLGILAQSIGGGGGVGGAASSANTISISVNARIGGSGGSYSNGGKVEVINSGTIATKGKEAHGIVAQSIGGGGGMYFLNRFDPSDPTQFATSKDEYDLIKLSMDLLSDLGVSSGGAANDVPTTYLSLPSLDYKVGGNGSGGGSGTDVIIHHSGRIETAGVGAFGIFAQSIGGGGGFGMDVTSAIHDAQIGAVFGGQGGEGGRGGPINIYFEQGATIQTSGAGAHAVFAQSIGGGGGYGGAGNYALPGSSGTVQNVINDSSASGNGGKIKIITENPADRINIGTSGAFAHGIFAQSLGGGGGALFDTTGRAIPITGDGTSRTRVNGIGETITITTTGDIVATGSGASAIFAQSGVQKTDGTLDQTKQGGDITIQHTGTLIGGSGVETGASAIRVEGGDTNKITLFGRVSAESGVAVLGTFGRETLINKGLLEGEINLVAGRSEEFNEFFNERNATYWGGSWGRVELGPQGMFKNDGVIQIGSSSRDMRSALRVAGDFAQSRLGTLVVKLTSSAAAWEAKSDLLEVSGSLTLDGSVKTRVQGSLRPESFKIATAGRYLNADPTVSSWDGGSPFLWTYRTEANSLYIMPRANFVAPAGLSTTASERNVMDFLQKAWNRGGFSSGMADLYGDFARLKSIQDYVQGINSLAPEETSSTLTTQTLNARASMHASLSCPIFEGSSTLMEESNCAWARIIGTWTDQGSSAEIAGYNQDAFTYRIGVQREVIDDWFVGATAGFTQSWLKDGGGLSSTEGNGADAALSLKHQIGPWLFAISGHLGFGNYETNRTIDIGNVIDLAEGTANVLTGGGRFRASYEFAFSNWYVKPYVDFDLLYTYMPGYQEQGIGTTLDFSSAQQWNFAFSPNVEFGGRLDLSPNTWLRPYGSVGMTFFAKDSMPIGVSLADADDVIGDFVTEVTMPSTLVNLAAGVQLFDTKGYEVRAEYKADIGDDYLSQELSARFAVQF